MHTTRIVVTGGAGFIGSHIVERLVNDGHEVVVLDDFSTGKRSNLGGVLDRITLVEGSVTSADDCARVVRGAEFVIHHAALASVEASVRDPMKSHAVNTGGTLQMLIAARDAGVRRFVYAASSSAYGNGGSTACFEHSVTAPCSPYAAAKLAGEHYLTAFHRGEGVETIALRYFNVFGPRQAPDSQYAAVVPRFIQSALEDQSPSIFGDGGQTRDFVYVQNVVDANILACDAPSSACGQAYNIGGGSAVSIIDLWHVIAEITGNERYPRFGPERIGEVRHSLASTDRAREVLGFIPRVALRDGLRLTIDAFPTVRRRAELAFSDA